MASLPSSLISQLLLCVIIPVQLTPLGGCWLPGYKEAQGLQDTLGIVCCAYYRDVLPDTDQEDPDRFKAPAATGIYFSYSQCSKIDKTPINTWVDKYMQANAFCTEVFSSFHSIVLIFEPHHCCRVSS